MSGGFSNRPDWHTWGVGIAAAVALRADCTRRRVGAVIFDEAHRILLFADPVRRRGDCIAVTHPPCPGCQKLLANSGLRVAVWPADDGSIVEWTIGTPRP